MATGNASKSVPRVVTSVVDMVGSSAAAQHPIFIAALQPMPLAAQQPEPSTLIPIGGMAQQPLYTQTASNPFSYGMPPITI